MTTSTASGLKPWWNFQGGQLPGVGAYSVNVASANILIQVDDMLASNAGAPLIMRRTYNSQSQHDALGSDGAQPSQIGNGWTSSFDAHLAANTAGGLTVFSTDGARFDYSSNGKGQWIPPTGIYASLSTYDSGASYYWTSPGGITFVFYGLSRQAYSGRLYRILGRNSNAYLSFAYSWDCGNSASSHNLNQITVTTQGGRAANLYFANFGPYRLLQTLVYPDGNSLTYQHDSSGDLTGVVRPSGSSQGSANEAYSYSASPRTLTVFDPRYESSGGGDGGWTYFTESATGQMTGVEAAAFVNPTPGDGTGTILEPGQTSGLAEYNYESVTVVSPTQLTFGDSYGHGRSYVVDSLGRVTTAYVYNGSVWMNGSFGWDQSNNRISAIDMRGYETDYAYDSSGNLISVALPSEVHSGSASAYRSTWLYSYDAYNNMTAACDPTFSHLEGLDWTSRPASSDSLCPNITGTWRQTWTATSTDIFGEHTSSIRPTGYIQSYAYQLELTRFRG